MSKSVKRDGLLIVILVIAICMAMAYVEIVMVPGYGIKSGIKMVLFLFIPGLFLLTSKKHSIKSFFQVKKKDLTTSGLIAAAAFSCILAGYFIFGNQFDFSSVAPSLRDNLGVTGDNFVFVALYISFVNSFMEEFFFRGFAFLALKRSLGRKVACLFSGGAFALYHVSIMDGWFSPVLMGLLILCLFGAGLLFNGLDDKKNTILPSWLVHISANLAINVIGCILLGILPKI